MRSEGKHPSKFRSNVSSFQWLWLKFSQNSANGNTKLTTTAEHKRQLWYFCEKCLVSVHLLFLKQSLTHCSHRSKLYVLHFHLSILFYVFRQTTSDVNKIIGKALKAGFCSLWKSASSSENPLLCVGHQRGNRQEVAATGSPGTVKTAPMETPGITAQHTQPHSQRCVYLCWLTTLWKKTQLVI